jgi:hypothetical protein
MKVFLLFVFLLAAPVLVRLVTNETPAADRSAETTLPKEKAVPPETAKPLPAPAPSDATTHVVTPAANPPKARPISAAHALNFM